MIRCVASKMVEAKNDATPGVQHFKRYTKKRENEVTINRRLSPANTKETVS
jgi:hypothetical protein